MYRVTDTSYSHDSDFAARSPGEPFHVVTPRTQSFQENAQEASELGLLWGPADLNDHRRGNQRNYAKFQTDLVFSPCSALVSVGGHKNGSVV